MTWTVSCSIVQCGTIAEPGDSATYPAPSTVPAGPLCMTRLGAVYDQIFRRGLDDADAPMSCPTLRAGITSTPCARTALSAPWIGTRTNRCAAYREPTHLRTIRKMLANLSHGCQRAWKSGRSETSPAIGAETPSLSVVGQHPLPGGLRETDSRMNRKSPAPKAWLRADTSWLYYIGHAASQYLVRCVMI